MSENAETAILAGGCFWLAQELLRHRAGVISTRVGNRGRFGLLGQQGHDQDQ